MTAPQNVDELQIQQAQRLKEELGRLQMKAEQAAEAGAVSRTAQFAYQRGETSPAAPYLARLAGRGVDVMYVLTGERGGAGGARLFVAECKAGTWLQASEPAQSYRSPVVKGDESSESRALLPAQGNSDVRPLVLTVEVQGAGKLDWIVMPKLVGPARAGRKEGAVAEPPVQFDRAGDMAFSGRWMAEQFGQTSGHLAQVQVVGDSMAPTLLDGDLIVVDTRVAEVTVDDIYVIHMHGQRLVKRLQRKLDGSLVVISDNSQYERETVPRSHVAEVRVVGRKVWPRTR